MGEPKRHQTARNQATVERRRGRPRVDVPQDIAVQVKPANVRVTLLNLSEGGCLIQGPVEHPTGQTLELSVAVVRRDPIVIRGRVVRTMRATSGELTSYISGLEFVDRDSPGWEDALKSLFGLFARA